MRHAKKQTEDAVPSFEEVLSDAEAALDFTPSFRDFLAKFRSARPHLIVDVTSVRKPGANAGVPALRRRHPELGWQVVWMKVFKRGSACGCAVCDGAYPGSAATPAPKSLRAARRPA